MTIPAPDPVEHGLRCLVCGAETEDLVPAEVFPDIVHAWCHECRETTDQEVTL